MKPGEEWLNGWRIQGCADKPTEEDEGCFWLVPTHGPSEHYHGTLAHARALLAGRQRPVKIEVLGGPGYIK